MPLDNPPLTLAVRAMEPMPPEPSPNPAELPRRAGGGTSPRFWFLTAAIAILGAPALQGGRAQGAERVHFSRDVLPILAQNCFTCHGPDAKARKADLRLDQKAIALRKSEPVIVPGKSQESELVERITSQELDLVMPPPKSGHKLSAHQIEILTRWIDQGAEWGRHWAFEPLARPAPPAAQVRSWARNHLDLFILARLESEGLQASGEAGRARLIRRLSLDLTGLPPTPEEVDAFLADPRPGAYEAVVERLLASPAYGERMATDWLDGARYADTNGYQNDFARTMWP